MTTRLPKTLDSRGIYPCGVYGEDKCLRYGSAVVARVFQTGNETETVAIADRLAACWNACEGIDDPQSLRRQRDELLAACKRISGLQEEYDGEPFETTFLAAEEIARAAIRACEITP